MSYLYNMPFYSNVMHLYHSASYLEFERLFDGQCGCHPSAVPVLIINTLFNPSRNIHTSYCCLLSSAPSALGKRDGCIRRSPYNTPLFFSIFFFKICRGCHLSLHIRTAVKGRYKVSTEKVHTFLKYCTYCTRSCKQTDGRMF